MIKIRYLLTSIAAAACLASCAHRLEPVSLSPTADPIQEMQSFESDLQDAKNQQIDVLAPDNFKTADEYLDEAKSRREKNEGGSRILQSISFGRAYLNEANKVAERNSVTLKDALTARQKAIDAGARDLEKDLASNDKDLKWAARRLEKGKTLDVDTLGRIQQAYLDLELNAIKTAKLMQAKNILSIAEKKNARRMVPRSFAAALAKVNAAEKAIETDRHDEVMVDRVSADATQTAKHMLTILETALAVKDKSSEAVAMELDRKNTQLAMDADRFRNVANEAVQNQNALKQAHGQMAKLRGEEAINEALKTAEREFDKNEAEVSRQGNTVVIRLKAMNFSTGSSELPAHSLDVLNKVKDILKESNPADIVVEGHTDATGPAALNKRLSESRADAVAKFLVGDEVSQEQVRAIGYGFEKPIASNKTKMGRAENRRVDIVIRPEPTATTERNLQQQ